MVFLAVIVVKLVLLLVFGLCTSEAKSLAVEFCENDLTFAGVVPAAGFSWTCLISVAEVER